MNIDLSSSTSADTTTAFAITGTDHCMIAVSDAFARLLGYTPAELCGRTFESITYAADADIDSDLAETLFAGRLASYEIAKRYESRDGQLVKVLLQVNATCNGAGRVAFAIAQVKQIISDEGSSLPQFQHAEAPSDEVEKIKRAMFW